MTELHPEGAESVAVSAARTRGPGPVDSHPRRPVSAPIVVRVPANIAAAIADRALRDGVTGATVTRRILAEQLDGDSSDVQPVRRYRASRPVPSPELTAVAGLRESVGEAVGTLRQVAGLDRARGGARLAELDAAIDGLLDAARGLDALKSELTDEPA